jgi:hypothetical protein
MNGKSVFNAFSLLLLCISFSDIDGFSIDALQDIVIRGRYAPEMRLSVTGRG